MAACIHRTINSKDLRSYKVTLNKTNHIEITRNTNTLPYQYLSTLKTRDDAYNNILTASIPNPLVNLVPGNSQGTYTGTTTSRQTLLFQ